MRNVDLSETEVIAIRAALGMKGGEMKGRNKHYASVPDLVWEGLVERGLAYRSNNRFEIKPIIYAASKKAALSVLLPGEKLGLAFTY